MVPISSSSEAAADYAMRYGRFAIYRHTAFQEALPAMTRA